VTFEIGADNQVRLKSRAKFEGKRVKHKLSLMIFRRDLRVDDNTALREAVENSERVICGFIFDPAQIESHGYKSRPGLDFMVGSLIELRKDLRKRGGELYFWKGKPELVIETLIKDLQLDAVYCNLDYTPFARSRDSRISDICKGRFFGFHDALINAPGKVVKDDGKPYQIYTPFFKAATKIEIVRPVQITLTNFYAGKINSGTLVEPEEISDIRARVAPGRNAGLDILDQITKFRNYNTERDIPSLNGTTFMGPHNKFGTVSIREFYYAVADSLGRDHTLIRELYWRDFFTHIGWHFPHVFQGAFNRKYDKLSWQNDQKRFQAWCEGRTGFPIVDAGMRQLKESAYMHNRVRMIVASFLTKDLLIDWRWGEKHFAQHLIDYDPAVNNGSWQWAASTGCDAQPYFRIFNPWLQQQRFDPQCEYIKKWVPELRTLSAKQIHALSKGDGLPLLGYPAQVVDHQESKIDAEEMFRAVG
jgi:deoxyribodipyrimidine photo-lyase